MRNIFLALLLLLTAALSACSFLTDFVIVNASGQPVEVKYKFAKTRNGAFEEPGKPAITSASQLSEREWRELSSAQYVFDRETCTVTVSLAPDTALRITRVRDWQAGSSMEDFLVREINIRTAGGELALRGDQVQKSFVATPKPFFRFGPPASATLTYR